MVDIVSEEKRSWIMSRIRSRDTKPELVMRKALHALGFRYRLHDKRLPGKPDLVLPKYKAVVQVHGCFWHRHEGCKLASVPDSRRDFWQEKFRRNVERDARNLGLLLEAGWRVKIVWECELAPSIRNATIADVAVWLRSGAPP